MADEPDVPLIKKVSITPIQQRIPAVNEDRTLSFALHGEINRLINALANVTNYNAETTQLIIDNLKAYGILVERVKTVEEAQAKSDAEAALISSYTDPTSVLTSTTGTADSVIAVQNHKRVYADANKTTVNVVGTTITGLVPDKFYYLYYDDPTFAGGAVTIKYSLNNLDAAQTGGRHSLGSIATPKIGGEPETGGGPTPPGGGGGYRRPQQNVNIQ
jgi:hypothetical protein